ncbi:MAG: 4Fe-4S binding protein [Leptospirillia bacterium]
MSEAAARPGARLIRIRRVVQWSVLAFLTLLPFTGLFRIDVVAGRFLVAGYQIWWDDFFIIIPIWAMLFLAATAFYPAFGMSFCGWLCPQNTLSGTLGALLRTLLGRRVTTGMSPEREGGKSKRKGLGKVLGWLLFGTVVMVVSGALALVLLAYFYPPSTLIAGVLGGRPEITLVGLTLTMAVLIAFDLGLIRYFWCQNMCPYGLWQFMFRGRDTLSLRFADERASDCRSCALCKDVCPMGLDPRRPEVDSRCINCVVCVDACEGYMGRFSKPALLSFGFGSRAEELIRIETRRSRWRQPKVLWPLAGVLLSAVLLLYGVGTYEPLKVVVHHELQGQMGTRGVHYLVVVTNKGRPGTFGVAVDGLPEGQARIGQERVAAGSGEEVSVSFRVIHDGLEYDKPYPFDVVLTREGGGDRKEVGTVYYLPRL